jgi:anti-sigma regulatory factor (Ser/Thr protein kinase)
VVERRDQSVDQGVRALCDALEAIGPSPTPAALCRATLRASSGPLDDDRAVLAMRTDLDPLPLWRIDLPADPASPSVARAHARALLREWSAESLAETVELLVSELVTNAVRHASGPGPTPRGPVFDADSEFELDRAQDGTLAAEDGELDLAALERVLLGDTAPDGLLDNAVLDGAVAALRNDRRIEVVMRRGRASLWVEVHDQDVRTPRVRTASANDEGGRGLFLVDQLSRRWGVRATPTGKAVWFQLPLRG